MVSPLWPNITCQDVDAQNLDTFHPCTRWSPRQPVGGRQKNCLLVQENNWVSEDCSKKKNFVCESKPVSADKDIQLRLKLDGSEADKIEAWMKKRTGRLSTNLPQSQPGFSLTWQTKDRNSTGRAQTFGLNKVLDRMSGYEWAALMISSYKKTVTTITRYRVVRAAKSRNMTNEEIWRMVKNWKLEAIQKKLFTCENDILNVDYFEILLNGLANKIPTDRPKVRYSETKDDFTLAFDIFSYMIFCDSKAFELLLHYENLLTAGNTQTILQATINNLKREYVHKSTKTALQAVYDGLNRILYLELAKIVTDLIASDSRRVPKKFKNDIFPENLDDVERSHWDSSRVAEVSNHPVAIQDKEGNLSPSSLIPFCSFGTEMLGVEVPNMTFLACNIFKPTIYQGQLCYQADVEKYRKHQTFQGKRSGLMMVIDVNSERSVSVENYERENRAQISKQNVYFGNDHEVDVNAAVIHIGTLTQLTVRGAGDYSLSSIKLLTGTENFLAWPEGKRKCALETYEKCQEKHFLDAFSRCDCSPFQLLPRAGLNNQVGKKRSKPPKVAGLWDCWDGLYKEETESYLQSGLHRDLC